MLDFPELRPQEPPESPPLVGPGDELEEDFMLISGVVSLIVCSLAVGGAQHFFYKKRGWRYKKVGNHWL